MKLKSVAGMVSYVKDIEKTADFYEKLGFIITKNEPDHLSIRLNWFWMDFYPQDKPDFQQEANLENKGAGLIAKAITPSSEPKDWPWGNREFVVRDPDGYKLVIFKRI